MSVTQTFDPQNLPWTDGNFFAKFVDLFGSQTISNRFIVYFIAGCLSIYVIGWAIEYGQFHRFPYVGGFVSQPEQTSENVPKKSKLGIVLVIFSYIGAELIAVGVENYPPGTLSVSILSAVASYAILIIVFGTPLGAYLYYLNRKAETEE